MGLDDLIDSDRDVFDAVFKNPVNRDLVERLARLGLRECHLTAGCLFQAIWNQRSGQEPSWGVKDYDVFYFDDRDLSWEAEDVVIRDVQALCADLGVVVEVKNQARVHLWYERRFGAAYPQLSSARDGIDRYLVSCTCIGIEVASNELYAPDGPQDLYEGVLRVNPRNQQAQRFYEKAASYRARWPWLTIVPVALGLAMGSSRNAEPAVNR